eukprot:COSAG06_NODE_6248_length_3015_cov_1.862826_2_plen_115_part_00
MHVALSALLPAGSERVRARQNHASRTVLNALGSVSGRCTWISPATARSADPWLIRGAREARGLGAVRARRNRTTVINARPLSRSGGGAAGTCSTSAVWLAVTERSSCRRLRVGR